jgi:hypothetical protein
MWKPTPVVKIVIGAAVGAYVCGEHLQYLQPQPKQVLGFVTAGSSLSSISIGAMYNFTSLTNIDPPPDVPPNQKVKQG